MSAMPDDIAKTLSKQDLRDLVEYLSGVVMRGALLPLALRDVSAFQ